MMIVAVHAVDTTHPPPTVHAADMPQIAATATTKSTAAQPTTTATTT